MRLLPLIQDIIPVIPDSVPSVKSELGMLKTLPVDELINRFVSGAVSLAINILIAVTVFYVGKFIIKKIYNILTNIMLRRRVDNSLMTFLLSFVRIVLYFILIVTVIGLLGIETSSFIALFASAGVAIGMALSGTLQNFAGGVLILLLKPYRVGDYIETQGYAGTVKEIQIFHTIILTPDNKSIIIPNGGLSTGSINNFSREDYRRVEWTVGISYGDSVDTARKAILDIIQADDRVVRQYLDDDRRQRAEVSAENQDEDNTETDEADGEDKRPGFFHRLWHRHRERVETWQEKEEKRVAALIPKADCSPVVVVDNLADSAVVLKVRAWTRTSDYWSVYFSINELIYEKLPEAGVSFPFPQLDVHLNHLDAPTPTDK